MSKTSTPSASSADRPAASLEEEFPEDPRLATLRRLTTLLLVVLIAGVSAVVIALLWKLREASFAPPPAERSAAQQVVPGLRPGERLVRAEADPDRITLLLEDAAGARRAVVLDGRTFRPLGAAADLGPTTDAAP